MNRFQKLDQCQTVAEVQAWLAEQEAEFEGREAELASVRRHAARKMKLLEESARHDDVP